MKIFRAENTMSAYRRVILEMFRRKVPELIQMSSVECGAACLAMILGYHGRKTSISEIRETYGIRSVHLPAIVHWQFNHFLVIERWSPSFVDVIDPASGKKRLTAQEFDA